MIKYSACHKLRSKKKSESLTEIKPVVRGMSLAHDKLNFPFFLRIMLLGNYRLLQQVSLLCSTGDSGVI